MEVSLAVASSLMFVKHAVGYSLFDVVVKIGFVGFLVAHKGTVCGAEHVHGEGEENSGYRHGHD